MKRPIYSFLSFLQEASYKLRKDFGNITWQIPFNEGNQFRLILFVEKMPYSDWRIVRDILEDTLLLTDSKVFIKKTEYKTFYCITYEGNKFEIRINLEKVWNT